VNHNFQYLSTNNLKKIDRDGAYANADLSKQVKFLMLKYNANSLTDELKDALLEFSDNEHELTNWLMRFQAILKPSLKSDSLAKQIYFPLDGGDYHLLTILKPSSLIHAIFQKYFEKSAKKQWDTLRKLKSKEKYNQESLKQLVNVAKVATTLSQPQNVSVLNGKRGGFIRLITTQPPTWQTSLKSPVTKNSLFDSMPMNPALREDIDYLRGFLLRFERIELSFKDPKKMAWIERWVNRIVDEVFAYCASIQNLSSGWTQSEDMKLKPEHRYFLDPYRKDDAFQAARKTNEWQAVVCDDFSRWLNHKLRGKDRAFTPQAEHTRIWKNLMQDELRVFDETIEMDIKSRQEQIV
jgi:CRISPR-associated protein Csy1